MKILKSLALASLLVAPIVSNASPINLGLITEDGRSFSSGSILAGSFSQEFDFTTDVTAGIAYFISTLKLTVASKGAVTPITNFAATLDGIDYDVFGTTTSTQKVGSVNYNKLTETLTGGITSADFNHQLIVSGIAVTNTSFSGDISVAAVPLPAGIWLFMTGLMGVLYAGKKKTQQA